MDNSRFNLVVVYEKFNACLLEEDDIYIKEYLESYEELNKFFDSMGTMFTFVTKELTSKMNIIRGYYKENEEGFKTVKAMIAFESDKLKKSGYVSGCRTLLQLHRALDFIRLFLKSVGELQFEENVGHVCRAAYDQTLGNHHSFFIAKGARLAMYTLPNKANLLKRVCGDDEEFQKSSLEALPKTLDVTATVFDRVQDLYTKHDLHKLP